MSFPKKLQIEENLILADVGAKSANELINNLKNHKLKNSTSAKDIPSWDSLNHVKLIITIENKFKIKFNADEIVEMKNVGDLIKNIKKKI